MVFCVFPVGCQERFSLDLWGTSLLQEACLLLDVLLLLLLGPTGRSTEGHGFLEALQLVAVSCSFLLVA